MVLTDILSLSLLIAGIVFIIFSRKKEQKNTFKWLGIALILAGIGISLPDFIQGLKDGYSQEMK
jgi:multidrug transporter EmrE-like cation transporter